MAARLLARNELSRYRHLTYPVLRELLDDPTRPDWVFAGIESGAGPTGLAICRAVPGAGFEIASLYSALRRIGCDDRAELLAAVMAEAARRGAGRGVFHATLEERDDETPLLLRGLGWRGPKLRNVVARTTAEAMLTIPFQNLGTLRPGYRLCGWGEVPAAARDDLRRRVESVAPDVRREIDPFHFEARADPEHSAALLAHSGEVIAWHLPERLTRRHMRWTCSTGIPGEKRGTAIMMLWKHVLARQLGAGVPELVWGVPILQPTMMRFVLTRLKPALKSLSFGVTFGFEPQAR